MCHWGISLVFSFLVPGIQDGTRNCHWCTWVISDGSAVLLGHVKLGLSIGVGLFHLTCGLLRG